MIDVVELLSRSGFKVYNTDYDTKKAQDSKHILDYYFNTYLSRILSEEDCFLSKLKEIRSDIPSGVDVDCCIRVGRFPDTNSWRSLRDIECTLVADKYSSTFFINEDQIIKLLRNQIRDIKIDSLI